MTAAPYAGRPRPVVRQVRFAWPDPFEPVWSNPPELALAANAVSMLMPHVEPYVVDAVAGVVGTLDGELAEDAAAFVRQERQHHGQHHRFNRQLTASFPGLSRIESLMARTFAQLGRRSSPRFALAFAAGFETVAFSAARWTANRQSALFTGADPDASRLFLWHLAEEVEHKAVAHEVYEAQGGGRLRYAAAMTLSMVMLALFSVMNMLTMMWSTRRIFHPVAHLRMTWWSITFLFELIPNMVLSAVPGHHPDRFVDPVFFDLRLDDFDVA